MVWRREGHRQPSVHPLHLAQDFALVHGQHGGVLPHLLEHCSALELVTGLLKVVPAEEKTQKSGLEGDFIGLKLFTAKL